MLNYILSDKQDTLENVGRCDDDCIGSDDLYLGNSPFFVTDEQFQTKLSVIASKLKDGQKIVFKIPDVYELNNNLIEGSLDMRVYNQHLVTPNFLHVFEPTLLKDVLEVNGFKVTKQKIDGFFYYCEAQKCKQ